jgi:hypothetical protein
MAEPMWDMEDDDEKWSIKKKVSVTIGVIIIFIVLYLWLA